MICWQVSNVTCVVEIFINVLLWLVILVAKSVSIEHTVGIHGTTIVDAILELSGIWAHLASQEILVDLLVWINTILIRHLRLNLLRSTTAHHFIHVHLLLLNWNFSRWLLFSRLLWGATILVLWYIIVCGLIRFSVHVLVY